MCCFIGVGCSPDIWNNRISVNLQKCAEHPHEQSVTDEIHKDADEDQTTTSPPLPVNATAVLIADMATPRLRGNHVNGLPHAIIVDCGTTKVSARRPVPIESVQSQDGKTVFSVNKAGEKLRRSSLGLRGPEQALIAHILEGATDDKANTTDILQIGPDNRMENITDTAIIVHSSVSIQTEDGAQHTEPEYRYAVRNQSLNPYSMIFSNYITRCKTTTPVIHIDCTNIDFASHAANFMIHDNNLLENCNGILLRSPGRARVSQNVIQVRCCDTVCLIFMYGRYWVSSLLLIDGCATVRIGISITWQRIAFAKCGSSYICTSSAQHDFIISNRS